MKNQKKRLGEQDYGFLAYGRNLAENGEKMIREVLKVCRSQPRQKKNLRTIKDLTQEEIDEIQEKNHGLHLPSEWSDCGHFYINVDGKSQREHPNLNYICQLYLDAQNDTIGEHNRQVQKEWSSDKQKFE